MIKSARNQQYGTPGGAAVDQFVGEHRAQEVRRPAEPVYRALQTLSLAARAFLAGEAVRQMRTQIVRQLRRARPDQPDQPINLSEIGVPDVASLGIGEYRGERRHH